MTHRERKRENEKKIHLNLFKRKLYAHKNSEEKRERDREGARENKSNK